MSQPPAPSSRWSAAALFVLRAALVCALLWLVNAGYALMNLPSTAPLAEFDWRAVPLPRDYATYALLFLTANSVPALRRWRMHVVALCSLWHLGHISLGATVYACIAIPVLFRSLGRNDIPDRRATIRFWSVLVLLLFLAPKCYQLHPGSPVLAFFRDAEVLFQGLILRYALYYYERVKGITPAGGFAAHVAYLLFIPQVYGILNFGPAEMATRQAHNHRTFVRACQSAGFAILKLATLHLLDRTILTSYGYQLGAEIMQQWSVGQLWIAILTNYFCWFLLLSASFDLMVTFIRALGIDIDNNFRWALLAATPIELWRRWNIYNRKLLLKLVYFPLGGNQSNVYLNIFLTFLASALLLHSGWFGGPWTYPNPARLLDEVVYFSGQALLVCVTFWLRHKLDLAAHPDGFSAPASATPLQRLFAHRGPWSIPLRAIGIAFTQASSAWLHCIILMGGHKIVFDDNVAPDLSARLALMWRALVG